MSATLIAKRVKDVVEITFQIPHPSEDGQRLDAKGKAVPATFIKQVLLKIDDRVVADVSMGGGLSHNPSLSFKAKNLRSGTRIVAEWVETDITLPFGAKPPKDPDELKGKTGQIQTAAP